MPNNTWFTPYTFSDSKCLSLGPSQGIVYQISDQTVIKVPYQYPVAETRPLDEDEINDQIHMSLRSFASFKKECTFYDVLAKNRHSNLLQRLQSNSLSGIVLPRLRPLEQAWAMQTKDTHLIWIQQLFAAVEWIEELGYTHGDLKIQNMGIDSYNQLKVFDFGVVMHRSEDGFQMQVMEDLFALATCIHFLASGIDPLAEAKSYQDVKEILSTLRDGRGIVDEAAKDFEKVIQAGWTGTVSTFSSLRQLIVGTENNYIVTEPFSGILDHSVLEHDTRWLDEEAYRAAWKDAGYEVPDNIYV